LARELQQDWQIPTTSLGVKKQVMKRKLTNKLAMFESVHTVLNDYQESWQTVPAMVTAIAKLDSNLSMLRQRLTEQGSATTGIREVKNTRILNLREQMYVLQKALYLHGKAADNMLLQVRYRMTRTELFSLNTLKLQTLCTELRADLIAYGAQLETMGITSEMITPVIEVVDELSDLRNSTRRAILQRKGITESINDLDKTLSNLLRDELDHLMLVFKQNREFYRAYTNARKVVDYRAPGVGVPPERDDGGSSAA
jgi:hypothetical protein